VASQLVVFQAVLSSIELVDWLVGQSVHLSVRQSVGRSFSLSVSQAVGLSVCQLT
jgi:hypothetical protein